MQDLTTTSVTQAVLDQMADTPDERLREVMASLVRHLHDFARDVKPTPDEWIKTIGFLTAVARNAPGAAGVHPAVGRAGPLGAGQPAA